MKKNTKIAILGAGNIGLSIAEGLVESKSISPGKVALTRRKVHMLDKYSERGFKVSNNNVEVVKSSNVIILAVEPQQISGLLEEISKALSPKKHLVISVASGVRTNQLRKLIKNDVEIVRVMPNTAMAVKESMTCITAGDLKSEGVKTACKIFDTVGKTLVIQEEKMIAATALGACGIAFFLRAIRAASQGGIEIGFNAGDALAIASQTAKGAATLLLTNENHPEYEIDKVTTPRGCTIAGLNRMEHEGFSSALIKGITVSAEQASGLYKNDK